MRYLAIDEVIELHRRVVEQSGGSHGLRDRAALESALAQPHQTFGGDELYATVIQKAAALGFFLVANHPFVDGNKRVGQASLEVTLVLNGFELHVPVIEQEGVILSVASGEMSREDLTTWVEQHTHRRGG